jgi:predicted protein tyrosine phosphatase
MIRWIENVSWDDVKNGWHSDMGSNAMLIQIADPATFFPDPKHTFKEIHQFEFLDAEDGDPFPEEAMITTEQAETIVALFYKALDRNMNVLVHCHAGICRSGAVVEVGSMIGFTPTERYRQPNLRVKHKMMRACGMYYDENEKTSSTGGWISAGGITIPFSD